MKKKDFSKTKKIVNIMCIISVSLFVLALIIFFASGSNKSNQKAEEIITKGEEKIRFSLNGDKVVKLYVGDTYVDSGFSLTGSSQDLRKYVSVKNEVDTTTKGKYKVTYTFNYNGITSQLVRQVVVYDEFMIKLKGSETFHVAKGTTFEDPGAVAKDPIDGDISDQIKVEGKVNSNNLGTYTLTYSVTNSSGKEAQAVRTVIVYEMNFTLTLLSSDYTSGDRVIEFKTDSPYYNYVKLPNGETNMGTTIQYKVTNNGSYTFSICDAKEICIDKTITVNNIDRVAPSGSCSGYYKNGKSVVTIKATDNVGVDRYAIDGYVYNVSTITLDKERASVQVKIYDKAGNSRTISCNLENKNTTSGGSTGGSTGGNTGGNAGGNTGGNTGGSGSLDSSGNRRYNDHVFVNSYTASDGKQFTYWFYIPSNVNSSTATVVYLGGLGERGNDYYEGTTTGISTGPIHEAVSYGYTYNAIIIQPELPWDQKWYGYYGSVMELTNKLISKYGSSKKKISLLGYSNGCYGGRDWVNSYPNTFSAAVLVECDIYNYNGFVITPTWFIAGQTTYKNSMESVVSKIKAAGGEAYFSYRPGYGHSMFHDQYSVLRDNSLNLINWMTSKSK